MLDFLTPLTPNDFNQNIEFLIEGFLPKHLITMIYSDGGEGKSWTALGLAKCAADSGMETYYLDYDNPMSVLKERGIEHKLIRVCPSLVYSHRSKTNLQPFAMLEEFEKVAVGGRFKNTFFVIDSMRDFGDVNNDLMAMRIGEKLKNIREAGATILVLHHSTKNGTNYQGSNNIRNSIDNMFQLKKIESPEGEIRWILKVKKERAPIVDTALSVRTDDLSIYTLDIDDARLSSEEKTFVAKVKQALTESPGINKTELLEACDYKKDDKTARDRLDQFEEIYWRSEKKSGSFAYYLIDSEA